MEGSEKVWAPIGALDIAKHPSAASCFVPWSLALAVVVTGTRALKWKLRLDSCQRLVSSPN